MTDQDRENITALADVIWDTLLCDSGGEKVAKLAKRLMPEVFEVLERKDEELTID
jgi:hypothetical protein